MPDSILCCVHFFSRHLAFLRQYSRVWTVVSGQGPYTRKSAGLTGVPYLCSAADCWFLLHLISRRFICFHCITLENRALSYRNLNQLPKKPNRFIQLIPFYQMWIFRIVTRPSLMHHVSAQGQISIQWGEFRCTQPNPANLIMTDYK